MYKNVNKPINLITVSTAKISYQYLITVLKMKTITVYTSFSIKVWQQIRHECCRAEQLPLLGTTLGYLICIEIAKMPSTYHFNVLRKQLSSILGGKRWGMNRNMKDIQ